VPCSGGCPDYWRRPHCRPLGLGMTKQPIRSTIRRGGFTLVELIVVISIIAALAAIGFPIWGMVNQRVKVSSTDTLVNSVATAITTYQSKTWTWNIETNPALPAQMRTYHMFDLNHFGGTNTPTAAPDLEDAPGGTKKFFSIDGYTPPEKDFYNDSTKTYADNIPPGELYDGNFHKTILNSGYRGFMVMAQPSIKKSFVNKKGQVVDAWQRPLRIAFYPKVFGTQPFGVWSAGRDGIDGIKSDQGGSPDQFFQDLDPTKTSDDLRSWESQSGK